MCARRARTIVPPWQPVCCTGRPFCGSRGEWNTPQSALFVTYHFPLRAPDATENIFHITVVDVQHGAHYESYVLHSLYYVVQSFFRPS